MNLIPWDDSFTVGVREIDRQHFKIIKLINELIYARNTNCDETTLINVLRDLMTYSQYHFRFEEKYFEDKEYRHISHHKKNHSVFEKKLFLLIEEYMESKTDITDDLLKYLKMWWVEHIMLEDMEFKRLRLTQDLTLMNKITKCVY